MAIEIERKFLVSGDFLPEAVSSTRIVQGYICSQPGRTVRIRIRGEEGFLTIKGASDEKGLSRYEFEQKIPLVDAERLLELCEPGAIDKVRYLVPRGSHTWEVDVFHAKIYDTLIPRNIRLAEAPSYGLPINLYDSKSAGAESYRLLAKEVIDRKDI